VKERVKESESVHARSRARDRLKRKVEEEGA